MTGSNKSGEEEAKAAAAVAPQSGDESEDDVEILEESPCGRWSKRRQEVQQKDVPGIDASYLAMDTEEGMEVVWNEVRFSEKRTLKEREELVTAAFNTLTELDHPNIVKLHSYWLESEKRRIVFITEYMSSGSLRKFLKMTKRNDKKVHISSWKKWCTQILSALGYLHSCSPPIMHGNLTADTIFIQSNGLIKISSVAPDVIQNHIKTCKTDMKNVHYVAPEYVNGELTAAVDVYAFGMCALEMAALEIPGSNGGGDSGHVVTQEQINKTIASLENPAQQDLIRTCLNSDPSKRPGVSDLLFHPVLFEVPSLKLMAAHVVLNGSNDQYTVEEILQHQYNQEAVIAEVRSRRTQEEAIVLKKYKLGDFTNTDKLEKFMEDVISGVHPMTAFGIGATGDEKSGASPTGSPTSQRRRGTEGGGTSPSSVQVDFRVTNMMCNIKPHEDGQSLYMTLSLRLDNRVNRQLSCLVEPNEEADLLADELVGYQFIAPEDKENVCTLVQTHLAQARLQKKLSLNNNKNNNKNNNNVNNNDTNQQQSSNGVITAATSESTTAPSNTATTTEPSTISNGGSVTTTTTTNGHHQLILGSNTSTSTTADSTINGNASSSSPHHTTTLINNNNNNASNTTIVTTTTSTSTTIRDNTTTLAGSNNSTVASTGNSSTNNLSSSSSNVHPNVSSNAPQSIAPSGGGRGTNSIRGSSRVPPSNSGTPSKVSR